MGFKISTSAYPLDSHPGFSLSSLSLILLCNTLRAELSQGGEVMTEKKELSKALKRKKKTKKQLKIFANIDAEAVILDVSRRRKGWGNKKHFSLIFFFVLLISRKKMLISPQSA